MAYFIYFFVCSFPLGSYESQTKQLVDKSPDSCDTAAKSDPAVTLGMNGHSLLR